MQHGSLHNMIAAPATEFEVGDGATVISWTDRHACTVIEVLRTKDGRVKGYVLQADRAIRTDGLGMSDAQTYTYERDPEGAIHPARIVATGKRKGQVYAGDRKVIRGRAHYYDFSF